MTMTSLTVSCCWINFQSENNVIVRAHLNGTGKKKFWVLIWKVGKVSIRRLETLLKWQPWQGWLTDDGHGSEMHIHRVITGWTLDTSAGYYSAELRVICKLGFFLIWVVVYHMNFTNWVKFSSRHGVLVYYSRLMLHVQYMFLVLCLASTLFC